MPLNKPSTNKEPLTLATIESLWTQAVSTKNPQDIKTYLLKLDDFVARVADISILDRNFDGTMVEVIDQKITKLLCDTEGNIIDIPTISVDEIVELGLSPDKVRATLPSNVEDALQRSRQLLTFLMKGVASK